jgi:crotonobetainyl-CoA:carnitine CoA-transferase CaiB-like acyl-CoA transferase
MVALWSGEGQVVDVNLLESLFQCMGPLPAAFATTGYLQPRLGSGIPYSVPRGTWQCSDGHWVAVSTSAESVAARVMDLIGFGDRTDLHTFNGRIAAREEVDVRMAEFCATRTLEEVLVAFEEAQAAAAPIYDMADIATDPHYAARGSIIEVDCVPMQGLVARLSATPGAVRWPGRALGVDPPEWAPPT